MANSMLAINIYLVSFYVTKNFQLEKHTAYQEKRPPFVILSDLVVPVTPSSIVSYVHVYLILYIYIVMLKTKIPLE